MNDQTSHADRDALHILPLSILPVQTAGLKRARMIKNVRLESVIEMFIEEGTGSGQLSVREIGQEFDWPDDSSHPDQVLLRKLEMMPSFDVYSLRILLREHGIKVEDEEALKLSPEMVRNLNEYMTDFTHPLIREIYGDSDVEISDFSDILKLFRDPDIRKAKEKLQQMADKLGIEMLEIPKFLEDYGDIFLSLSYYHQCLDRIEPVIGEFFAAMDEIRANYQLSQDKNLMQTCDMLERTINGLMIQISGRFETFDRSSKELWNEISAERFRKVKELIEGYHTTIGGVLCALSVKIDAWHALFPSKDIGGPVKRGEFILSEMKQGIDNIKKIEADAPILAQLESTPPPQEEAPAEGDDKKEGSFLLVDG
ncbi:MAG: hypothetical protein ACTSV1_10645 [Alphaproteobacteria bacterium]